MIARFTKEAGSGILPSTEDPSMALITIGGIVPDDVTLPPELGGQTLRVIDHGTAKCPCGGGHHVRHLLLEGGYGVAECEQFLWYRLRKQGK